MKWYKFCVFCHFFVLPYLSLTSFTECMACLSQVFTVSCVVCYSLKKFSPCLSHRQDSHMWPLMMDCQLFCLIVTVKPEVFDAVIMPLTCCVLCSCLLIVRLIFSVYYLFLQYFDTVGWKLYYYQYYPFSCPCLQSIFLLLCLTSVLMQDLL